MKQPIKMTRDEWGDKLYEEMEKFWQRWAKSVPEGQTLSEREFELWVDLGEILGKEIR